MDKQTISFKVQDQRVESMQPLPTFASDTINYIEAHFDLDRRWDGYDTVYAVWYTDVMHLQKSEIVDGVTVIPQEILTSPGVLRMNLCANKVEDGVLVARMTSYPIDVLILFRARV